MTPQLLTGPARILAAIVDAPLDKTDKLILVGLARHADWESWIVRAGVPRIARNSSHCVRAVQSSLSRLERGRLIEFVERSDGNRPHKVRIRVDTLESLAHPARDAGSSPAPEDPTPRTPCGVTPHLTTDHPAPGAGEQNTEQKTEQTTTTTSGGGGGHSLVEHMSEALVAAGVSQNDAHRLARLPGITPTLVTFAVEQARRPGVHNPGRYIAKLLRTPLKDLDGYERFEADRLNRRQGRFTRLLAAAGERAQRGHADAGQLRADAAIIRSVWPDGFAFATDFVLPDAELLAKDADLLVLFGRIAEVARSRRTAKNPAA